MKDETYKKLKKIIQRIQEIFSSKEGLVSEFKDYKVFKFSDRYYNIICNKNPSGEFFVSVCPDIEVDENFKQVFKNSDRYYQIYGDFEGDDIRISELAKKNLDMKVYFESYFRDEIESKEGLELLEEFEAVLNILSL